MGESIPGPSPLCRAGNELCSVRDPELTDYKGHNLEDTFRGHELSRGDEIARHILQSKAYAHGKEAKNHRQTAQVDAYRLKGQIAPITIMT